MLDGNNLDAAGQLEWLKDGLLNSTARWKVIFTSVSINPTTKFLMDERGNKTEWDALRNFIESNHITGVVFISGDLHVGAIDNGTEAGFPEMCVAPPGGEPLAGRCAISYPGTWSEGFFDSCATYGLVSVSDAQNSLTLQVVDQFGTPQITYTVTGAAPSPNTDADTYTHGHAERHGISDTDAVADADTYTHGHAISHAHPERYAVSDLYP